MKLQKFAGWSFVFDPVFGDPSDPVWLAFCEAILPVAKSLGARVSATQTKQLGSQQLQLLPGVAKQRFTTPYFQQFSLTAL